MKHYFSGMMIALALVLALVVGVVALAETAEPEAPELPPVTELQPDQDAQQSAGDATGDDTALQEAFDAYRAAKESGHQEALEAELKGYVESGKLTQAQADLILNYYKEQQSLRNGTCPSCGYQFQNGNGMGKGGRMNGGHGMMGGKGGRGMMGGKGGRGMMGGMFGQQAPDQQPSDGQASGTAFTPDMQAMQYPNGTEGI